MKGNSSCTTGLVVEGWSKSRAFLVFPAAPVAQKEGWMGAASAHERVGWGGGERAALPREDEVITALELF